MNEGKKVKVNYTGTFDDGKIFDSSEGRAPLEFTIGNNQVIKGFENAIREMKVNDEKSIKIPAKEAYGERDENLMVKIPRDKFPPEVELGGNLILKGPNGEQIPAIIKEVENDSVTIDLNHPLAGKQLNFKLKLVEAD